MICLISKQKKISEKLLKTSTLEFSFNIFQDFSKKLNIFKLSFMLQNISQVLCTYQCITLNVGYLAFSHFCNFSKILIKRFSRLVQN